MVSLSTSDSGLGFGFEKFLRRRLLVGGHAGGRERRRRRRRKGGDQLGRKEEVRWKNEAEIHQMEEDVSM